MMCDVSNCIHNNGNKGCDLDHDEIYISDAESWFPQCQNYAEKPEEPLSDSEVLVCPECETPIICDCNGEMPDVCRVCGEGIDYSDFDDLEY